MKLLRERLLGDRGATALEFALVAPAALVAISGLVEFTLQGATAVALDQAARKASRAGITGSKLDGTAATNAERNEAIRQAVLSGGGGWLKEDNLTVTPFSYASVADAKAGTNAAAGPGGANQVVNYVLTYKQPFFQSWVKYAAADKTELTHTSTMLVKNEPFPSNN